MGKALGWQRMCDVYPYIDGQAFQDGLSRDNANHVSFDFNLCMKTPTYLAYWNYAWYVDMHCGGIESNGRQVKELVYYNKVIQGIEFYQSTFNGNFKGTITVDGKASTIALSTHFHDSAGNQGGWITWNVPIPTATEPSNISAGVSGITEETATIKGTITSKGNYATITRWTLEYGVNSYDEHTSNQDGDAKTRTWGLAGLIPDTTYKYRITVWNSAGYSKQTTGTFKTIEETIGYIITEDFTKQIKGWVIKPDGTKNKIKNIRKVV